MRDPLRLSDLMPQVSCTVLRCTREDLAAAFATLVDFIGKTVLDPGRASAANVLADVRVTAGEVVGDLGPLSEYGLDDLFCVAREVVRPPTWIDGDAGLHDVEHELVIAVRRGDLVAVCGPKPTHSQFRRWIDKNLAPFRFIGSEVLASAFPGDGKVVWLRGIHRPRSSKPGYKALGSSRVQDALNPIEDSSFVLGASTVDFQPEDEARLFRNRVTVSPDESRISWQRAAMPVFLRVMVEVFDVLDKALVGSGEPEPVFTGLAATVKDLGGVRDAYEVVVAHDELLLGDPGADEGRVRAAASLLDAVVQVRPRAGTADVEIDVGRGGAVSGTLLLRPVPAPGGFALEVRVVAVLCEPIMREIKSALDDGAPIAVHYQSGHVFRDGRVFREPVSLLPFREVEFADFTGFTITREKPEQPEGLALHDAIGLPGDTSLFAWVVRRYRTGWLLCDDGAGEVADFLHLSDEGTLTVVHVKAAGGSTDRRRIAVGPFEQVVSQAAKNLGHLDADALLAKLDAGRVEGSAAWRDGERAEAAEFVAQLRLRVASDLTFVVIVQPHLLKGAHDRARAEIDAGERTQDSCSLRLLDHLLHTARGAVIARCDGLRVIGCA